MSVQLPPPYYKRLPIFTKKYQDTPDNIEKIASKVAKLYAFFLTPAAHDENGELCTELRNLGTRLMIHLSAQYPSQDELADFESLLKSEIIEALSSSDPKKREILLNVDYHPEGILNYVVKKTIKTIDREIYSVRFPSKSYLQIEIDNDQISMRAAFALYANMKK